MKYLHHSPLIGAALLAGAALCAEAFLFSTKAQAAEAAPALQGGEPVPAAAVVPAAGAEPAPAPEPAAEPTSTEGEPLPAEGLPLPVYTPPKPEPVQGTPEAEELVAAAKPARDELLYSGYLPGYRRSVDLGQDPAEPSVGSLPGPTTPGFTAPVPPSEWAFSFHGFMTVSAQMSFDARRDPTADQSTTVSHVIPQTVDTYMYFTSTNAVPGNWVNLRFRYGTGNVSANFSVDTYNPSTPATFYQMGAQYFINNAYLSYVIAPISALSVTVDAGRFNISHGQLSRYGNGLYTATTPGLMQGVGIRAVGVYDVMPSVQAYVEAEVLASSDGTIPYNVVRSQENGWRRPLWAGSYMVGAHIGFNAGTAPRYEVRARYLTNRATDDRLVSPNQVPGDSAGPTTYDDPGTRPVDEAHLRDGSLDIYAADVKLLDDRWGVLGLGGSYTVAHDAYPLRGLMTYGGNGEELTERFLGVQSGGTGNLFALSASYSGSLRQIGQQLWGGAGGMGTDLAVNLGGQYVSTSGTHDTFDGRARYKMGGELIAVLFQYANLALRVDHVVPDHRDPSQTFNVIAPRLQFKTDWASREVLQIMYAKWLFGSRTRNEGTGERSQEQLDDDLFAINLNMWW